MDDLPMPELKFPCEYPVKVIGRDEAGFFEFVTELVSRHVPGLTLDSFTSRRSGGGKYLSISVTFIAQSRAQVDALYLDLGADPRVLVAL
jgi:uncharacterized protein